MAFCAKCGTEKPYEYGRCEKCGFQPEARITKPIQSDDGGFLWGLLGFCVPIAGLVLYLIWKDERPLTAKAAGIGALVYVGFIILVYILYFVLIIPFLLNMQI